MNRYLQIVCSIAVSLWLGGLIALFVFVTALFKTDRSIGLIAAPILFHSFAAYQLIVGAAGLIALCFWRAIVRSRWINVMIVMFAISLALAAYVTFSMIQEMEAIRDAGHSGDSPRFKTLHGLSMVLYLSQAIALLFCAVILPLAISASAASRTRREIVPATDSPDGTADRVPAR
ncbi:hypothetical protein BH09PLA1_BH09PLA1_37130 [soil metagenome]